MFLEFWYACLAVNFDKIVNRKKIFKFFRVWAYDPGGEGGGGGGGYDPSAFYVVEIEHKTSLMNLNIRRLYLFLFFIQSRAISK